MASSIVSHLDARDRALFARLFLGSASRRTVCVTWRIITHAGGFWGSVLAAGLPWLACCAWQDAAEAAMISLAVSHLLVQILKRGCGRPRPAPAGEQRALIAVPDQFSFPSGHACASMAVALSYAIAFPSLGVLLTGLAMIIGLSRVFLGVHYPGDVLTGQLIAAVTAVGVAMIR